MNQSESKMLMSQFQTWLRTEFLPGEERIGGKKMSDEERAADFNRLSMMWANFVFNPAIVESLLMSDTNVVVRAYGDLVTAVIKERCLEQGLQLTPHEMKLQQEYYLWPVCDFIAGRQMAAQGN